VDTVLASPLGVSWLAVLEAGPTGDEGWRRPSPTSRPASVAAAVRLIGETSFGTLTDAAVYAAVMEAGPWNGDAPTRIAAAYRQAERRTPIAEAIVERFADELKTPLDRTAQQWWTDGNPGIESLGPLFRRFDHVYGAGEFTWAGLRTATDPPPEVLLQMVAAWEIETGPVSRWWLPVRPEARVFEIHHPEDWARLVTTYPYPARPHPGWELPGVGQHPHLIAPLLTVAEQRAARPSVNRHLVPDWRSVAHDYDGIHLSWAGFITAEGCIVDLGHGDVTMLRYWFSERTLWLADTFGEPRPAPDPQINFAAEHSPASPPRTTITREFILGLLGR